MEFDFPAIIKSVLVYFVDDLTFYQSICFIYDFGAKIPNPLVPLRFPIVPFLMWKIQLFFDCNGMNHNFLFNFQKKIS